MDDINKSLFNAIWNNNLDEVSNIIKQSPEVLNQIYEETTPIFHAISRGNPEIVKAIIDKDPEVLNQTMDDTINFVIEQSFWALESDKYKEILRIFLEKKFLNLPDDSQSNLEELFLNKTLLAGLYSKEGMPTGLKILKKAILKTIDKDQSTNLQQENPFDAIYKEIFSKVDSHDEINDKDKKMFIYSSNLKNHKSYFIFHVNKDNRLESIIYCDGNRIEKSRNIKDSSTHINGITTFKLKNPVEYYYSIVREFINKNTNEKPNTEFYQTLRDRRIEIEVAEIDYEKTEHSIPTEAQKRGNCVFKSTALLARFLLQKKDPEMICDFDQKTQKPCGKGHEEYKKFKQILIKKTLKSIKDLESKLPIEEVQDSKPNSFNKYLKEEIKKTLDKTLNKVTDKLSPKKSNFISKIFTSFANLSPSFSSVRSSSPRNKEFHLKVFDIYNGNDEKGKEDEIPKVSCLPFSVKRIFSSKSTPLSK